ncbi:MAG: hypothetical protein Kow002_14110 [Anaerolineales bacterium]
MWDLLSPRLPHFTLHSPQTDYLALIVEPDGTLTVRAPQRMKDAVRPREYVDGETFLYLGQEYPLRIIPNEKPALVFDTCFRLTQSTLRDAESLLVAWHKTRRAWLKRHGRALTL